MGFLFGKKEAPTELPDLISDEISNQLNSELGVSTKSSEMSGNNSPNAGSSFFKSSRTESFPKKSAASFANSEPDSGVLKKLPIVDEDQPGYFKELIKGVMAEDFKATAWKSKFMPKDIVSNMREYWEKQSPDRILNSVGGETKAQLLQQVEKLHTLEKEWQSNYLSLISCEDKIREEEKQLKEKITEFISLYKRTLNRSKRR